MDIYAQTISFLLQLPLVGDWPAALALLEQAASRQPRDWNLPLLACQAVGGDLDRAIPASASLACLQMSIILVDDMLDADPRGLHHSIGRPKTANLAVAFQAAGLEAIARSDTTQDVKLALFQGLNQMMLTTAYGQDLDTTCNPKDEASYWHLVRMKSAPFFGAALYAGALLAGGTPETADRLRGFGLIYGEVIQIHDDMKDVMATPANPDWTLGRPALPILYARVVEHPDRERFLELLQAVPDPEALAEAQAILIRCGAIGYCVDQLLCRCRELRDSLADVALDNTDGLQTLLEPLVSPIRRLFSSIGAADPEVLRELRP